MIGPGGVVQLLVARLQGTLPGVLAAYRARDGLTLRDLPEPTVYGDWPPQSIGLDLMPSLWVTEVGMNVVQGAFRSSPDPLDANWMLRYSLAVDGYVRSASEHEVARQRRYLVTAIRQTLLGDPGLLDTDRGDPAPEFYAASIRIPGWKERYSNLGTVNDDLVAGLTVELDVDAEERMTPVPGPVGIFEHAEVEIINVPVSTGPGSWTPPVPPPGALTANMVGLNGAGQAVIGQPVEVYVTFGGREAELTELVSIEWGDDVIDAPPSSWAHTYAEEDGALTVTVTAADGQVAQTSPPFDVVLP